MLQPMRFLWRPLTNMVLGNPAQGDAHNDYHDDYHGEDDDDDEI